MIESRGECRLVYCQLRVFCIQTDKKQEMLTNPRTISIFPRNIAVKFALCSLLIFAACAELPSDKSAVSDEDSCQNLKNIIADYPSRFSKFKSGAPSNNPWQSANVWKTEPLFAGTDCQVWAWAKGLSNYSCQWTESDEEVAHASYDKYKPKILSCLGNEWTASEPQAKTGKQSIFKSKSTTAVVSIRYFQNTRPAFSKPWYTSMIIGDLVQTVKD